ncbi:MAG: PaaX family transcriptional regulator [Microbacterium gubbeenense]|uniref:PaaX family transcriptional regulator n=1 Tax=Microbacteriaceae TaxID=85023 RepID=UPI00056281E6|nr:PaaX family transcriptional regulator [Microbacterium gubbeenense]
MTSHISPRTLLEALLPFDGDASLGVVYDTANLVHIKDQPVRLALRRLIAAGDIVQVGRGRGGTIALTSSGRARLSRDRVGLQLAFSQDSDLAGWDGNWHLLALGAPESERAIRDAFRRDVQALGAASISTGLYLTPHDVAPLLPEQVGRYLVTATATTMSVRGMTEPRAITEALWPAHDTVTSYTALDAALDADDDETDPLARQLFLAGALDAALRNDPLVPPELRRTPWPPTEIRRRWLTHWHDAISSAEGPQVYQGWLRD